MNTEYRIGLKVLYADQPYRCVTHHTLLIHSDVYPLKRDLILSLCHASGFCGQTERIEKQWSEKIDDGNSRYYYQVFVECDSGD